MSLEESFKKRIAKCRREDDIINKQLPVLLDKLETLFPTGEKMESSEPENKSGTNKKVGPLQPLTPEEIAKHYKDLQETINRFLKDLEEAEKETGETSQATPPPSVEDE